VCKIAEILAGEPNRGRALRLGDFYWQEPGRTRGIRNTGTSRIEIAEFELKSSTLWYGKRRRMV
jgi:hypothetical protein